MSRLILKVLPIPSSAEEKRDNIIKYQIVTQADQKSARVFYTLNIKKAIPLMVQIEKWYQHRTLKQNSFLHIVLRRIAVDQNDNIDMLKQGIIEAVGIRIKYKDKEILKPIENYNSWEYNRIIERAINEAAEVGIDVKKEKIEYEQWKQENLATPLLDEMKKDDSEKTELTEQDMDSIPF